MSDRRRSTPDPGEPYDRLLFEANPLPLWIYDLETLRILDVNQIQGYLISKPLPFEGISALVRKDAEAGR